MQIGRKSFPALRYIPRQLARVLLDAYRHFPAVVVTGPRHNYNQRVWRGRYLQQPYRGERHNGHGNVHNHGYRCTDGEDRQRRHDPGRNQQHSYALPKLMSLSLWPSVWLPGAA